MFLLIVSLDHKKNNLKIYTGVKNSIISVFVDSRTGLYDVTISNCQGTVAKYSCITSKFVLKTPIFASKMCSKAEPVVWRNCEWFDKRQTRCI